MKFKCMLCDKGLSSKQKLNEHMTRLHKEHLASSTEDVATAATATATITEDIEINMNELDEMLTFEDYDETDNNVEIDDLLTNVTKTTTKKKKSKKMKDEKTMMADNLNLTNDDLELLYESFND